MTGVQGSFLKLRKPKHSSDQEEKTMITSRFSYLKTSALIAVIAMTLIPCPRTSAGRRLSQTMPGVADFGNEQRIIGRYRDDLAAYDKETQALGNRARLVSSDLDGVQNRSEDLKR